MWTEISCDVARSPAGHRQIDAFSVKACIDALQKALTIVEIMAADLAMAHPAAHGRDQSSKLIMLEDGRTG
jgi:hypothetical protein